MSETSCFIQRCGCVGQRRVCKTLEVIFLPLLGGIMFLYHTSRKTAVLMVGFSREHNDQQCDVHGLEVRLKELELLSQRREDRRGKL